MDDMEQLQTENKEMSDDLDLHDIIVDTYKSEIKQLQTENKRLRTVLEHITPSQLMALAAWLDKTDAQIGHTGDEVQVDLREWATLLETLND